MLVVEVDVVGAQPAERALDGEPDVLARAVEATDLLCRPPAVAAAVGDLPVLRCQDDLVAASGQRLPDQFLVGVWAVDFGAVQEGDAEF